jgi:hypothetical protein
MPRRLLASALVPLVLAACGGGHERRPVPTKAAFAADADAICTKSTTRTGRLARLRALRPPRGTDDLYPRWLKAEADALEAVTPSDRPPEPDTPPRSTLLAIAQGKIAGYARRLGAQACARGAMGTLPP